MNSDDYEWLERQSDKIHAEMLAFMAAHPFKGRTASNAVDQLRSEGFVCGIRYLNLGTPSAPVPKAYVRCELPEVAPTDTCKSRGVNLLMDWPTGVFDNEDLTSQLRTREIAQQYFDCEARENGPPKH